MKVYVIDLNLDADASSWWPNVSDEEFITKAKQQGTQVYSLKDFEMKLNLDKINVDNYFFRFVEDVIHPIPKLYPIDRRIIKK